jgi:hypothetical protein
MKIKSGMVIRKMGLLARENHLMLWRSENEIEATITLSRKKGLIVTISWNEKGGVEITVQRTVNGCPGCGTSDFRKVYRKR